MRTHHFGIPCGAITPRILFLVLAIIMRFNTFAQNPFREYLLNRSDEDIQAFRLSLNELYDDPAMAKPLLRQIELRTETDRFQLDRQEYTMRLGLNEFGNKHVQRQMNRKDQQLLQLEVEAWEAEMLYQKYLNIARLLELVEADSISENRLHLIERQRDILALGIPDKPSVAKELLKLDIDRAEVMAQRNAIIVELKALLQITGVSIDQAVLRLPPPKVESIVHFVSGSFVTGQYSKIPDVKKQRIGIAHQLRLAEDRQILDFVQFRYSPRQDELFEERASVGIGLRLPSFFNKSRRNSIARADTLHFGMETAMEKRQLETELEKQQLELQAIAEEYTSVHQAIEAFANSASVEKLLTVNIMDPASVIEVSEMLTRQKEKQLHRYYQLLRSYLKYLYKSGVMASHGAVDYLSIPFRPL